MAVERRSVSINILTNILELSPSQRKPEEVEQLVKFSSLFKFFQDIIERHSSTDMVADIVKFLVLQTFEPGDIVFRTGDPSLDFYFIIRGSVRILSNTWVDLEDAGDDELHKAIRKNLEIAHPRAKKQNEPMPETEVSVLGFGESFGETAIINEKPRYYTAQCTEKVSLVVLRRSDYFKIEGTQEKVIAEKRDFLQSLEEFKFWSKLSLYKLTFFFKEMKIGRGGIVYNEGDSPNAVYIIREGDFKFTQQFAVNAGNGSFIGSKESRNRAPLKSAKHSKIRTKELQIVTKQAGEIFGYQEILEKLPSRQFTCKCISQTGRLLWISEKNFTKRVTHPETNKVIEEQCNIFKAWVVPRLALLKELEIYKDEKSFTPYQKLKVTPRAEVSVTSRKISSYSEFIDEGREAFPVILKKILNTRNNSAAVSPRHRRQQSSGFPMFATEIQNYKKNKEIRLSTTIYPSSPRDLGGFFPSKLVKVRKQKTNLI